MTEALRELLRHDGRLFHGSPRPGLTLIEPRKTVDAAGNVFNTDTAIFATHHACMAMIFGVVDPKKLPPEIRKGTWSVDHAEKSGGIEIQSRIPDAWRRYVEDAAGFVYVLPRDTFLQTDGLQWKSKVPVAPAACITVTLKDFLAAGGKLEWKTAPGS